jgi:hypothetical protein
MFLKSKCDVKVKLSACLTKYRRVKMCDGVEVQVHEWRWVVSFTLWPPYSSRGSLEPFRPGGLSAACCGENKRVGRAGNRTRDKCVQRGSRKMAYLWSGGAGNRRCPESRTNGSVAEQKKCLCGKNVRTNFIPNVWGSGDLAPMLHATATQLPPPSPAEEPLMSIIEGVRKVQGRIRSYVGTKYGFVLAGNWIPDTSVIHPTMQSLYALTLLKPFS